jgi:hypothetical protein
MRAYAIAVVTAFLCDAASASEPSVVWRSTTSGVLALAPASETPATSFVGAYGGNRAWPGIDEPVLLTPAVSGGSGRHEYALATAMPLPAGLAFASSTGIFSGRVQVADDYRWSILVSDVATG